MKYVYMKMIILLNNIYMEFQLSRINNFCRRHVGTPGCIINCNKQPIPTPTPKTNNNFKLIFNLNDIQKYSFYHDDGLLIDGIGRVREIKTILKLKNTLPDSDQNIVYNVIYIYYLTEYEDTTQNTLSGWGYITTNLNLNNNLGVRSPFTLTDVSTYLLAYDLFYPTQSMSSNNNLFFSKTTDQVSNDTVILLDNNDGRRVSLKFIIDKNSMLLTIEGQPL